MFKYFFTEAGNLPANVGFDMYGTAHINWLCIILLFIIFMSIKYKKMSAEKKIKTRKILGTIILMTEIYYQLVLIITGQFKVGYLPLHLCGIAIFLYFFDAFRPNAVVRDFIYCLCMPGALMALLFPNWTMYPLINFASINSFILHGLLLTYPIMLICAKELIPDYKNLPKCSLYLLIIAVPIYFFNKIFDTNFLFINDPFEVVPLVVFEQWFGNPGYILGMVILIAIAWVILYAPIFVKNKRNDATLKRVKIT